MKRFTNDALTQATNKINYYRACEFYDNYCSIRPRNGCSAVDLFTISADGSIKYAVNLDCGLPCECERSMYDHHNSSYYQTKIKTRQQAKIVLAILGVDFSKDYHQLGLEYAALLHDLAKLTKYRKPVNANGSLARYFFAHLNKSKYDNLDLTGAIQLFTENA